MGRKLKTDVSFGLEGHNASGVEGIVNGVLVHKYVCTLSVCCDVFVFNHAPTNQSSSSSYTETHKIAHTVLILHPTGLPAG